MKKFSILFVLFFPIITLSQEPVEDIYGYVKVYSIEGKLQNEIHSNILEWIGENFKSLSSC